MRIVYWLLLPVVLIMVTLTEMALLTSYNLYKATHYLFEKLKTMGGLQP